MVVCMLDLIEKLGFRWNGKYYTCGFYRIKDNMGTYYLEKFVGYRNRRVEYNTIGYLYTSNVTNSWFEVEVNDQKLDIFKNAIRQSVRDTKLKRLEGYFKHEEYYYSELHSKH